MPALSPVRRISFGLAVALLASSARAASPGVATTPVPFAQPAAPPPAPTLSAPPPDDGEGEPKLSLPTESDRAAWQRSGFRFGLGASYGQLEGLGGAPSGRLLGFLFRLGLRLDPDWSVLASFQYARASAKGGLYGLRFSGTLDPTWHATRHLSLALGVGFGGLVEGNTGRPDVDPLPSTLDASYTFPNARTPLPSCSGIGAVGLGRAEWSFVLGPRSATSLLLEGSGQWTGCVADTGRVEPDTGHAIVRRQWWPHVGVIAGWGITWR